jgi:hypothetical protein
VKKFNQNETVVEAFLKTQAKNFQLENSLNKLDSNDLSMGTRIFLKNTQIFL